MINDFMAKEGLLVEIENTKQDAQKLNKDGSANENLILSMKWKRKREFFTLYSQFVLSFINLLYYRNIDYLKIIENGDVVLKKDEIKDLSKHLEKT